jgi:hypothetical protein
MMPTMRDPKAIRIDTTPIGTEDLSKASTLFGDVKVEVEVGVRRVGEVETGLGRAVAVVVELWSNCDMIGWGRQWTRMH